MFFLLGYRQWDKLLGFGSSSFLKVLRQADAIPGTEVEKLKSELRSPKTQIEDAANLKPLLTAAEEELRRFMMLQDGGSLVYRATSLDTIGVLQSLLPHIKDSSGQLLPLSRQGAGMVSLQCDCSHARRPPPVAVHAFATLPTAPRHGIDNPQFCPRRSKSLAQKRGLIAAPDHL